VRNFRRNRRGIQFRQGPLERAISKVVAAGKCFGQLPQS